MQFIPSDHSDLGNSSGSANFFHGLALLSSTEMTKMASSSLSTISRAQAEEEAAAKAVAASKSHSEAERRRRKRINGHLATLRTLLPTTIKTDKASLLAEVVRHVRELKKSTAELGANNQSDDGCDYRSMGSDYVFPSENDELKLCHGDPGIIIVTICCEDRPELIRELTRALGSVHAKVVRAEMTAVGGRMKSVFWVRISTTGDEGLRMIRQALKTVIDGAALPIGSAGQVLLKAKAARLSHY